MGRAPHQGKQAQRSRARAGAAAFRAAGDITTGRRLSAPSADVIVAWRAGGAGVSAAAVSTGAGTGVGAGVGVAAGWRFRGEKTRSTVAASMSRTGERGWAFAGGAAGAFSFSRRGYIVDMRDLFRLRELLALVGIVRRPGAAPARGGGSSGVAARRLGAPVPPRARRRVERRRNARRPHAAGHFLRSASFAAGAAKRRAAGRGSRMQRLVKLSHCAWTRAARCMRF